MRIENKDGKKTVHVEPFFGKDEREEEVKLKGQHLIEKRMMSDLNKVQKSKYCILENGKRRKILVDSYTKGIVTKKDGNKLGMKKRTARHLMILNFKKDMGRITVNNPYFLRYADTKEFLKSSADKG